ncbi:hypothetical protein [Curtobacterium sp. MCBD17_040]|uniref:hypothetical protein n=1 Tax=Curtobacterium sp. MCBD17_040 TaxID=2175674 RepID=UPI0011B65FB2|nr:hypothetical protein [Curtobacterium sp. MCBD17_040]WIB64381.1 hypothetical protein DEI94_04070 [Curtobacterium sp. MCBD17_040]
MTGQTVGPGFVVLDPEHVQMPTTSEQPRWGILVRCHLCGRELVVRLQTLARYGSCSRECAAAAGLSGKAGRSPEGIRKRSEARQRREKDAVERREAQRFLTPQMRALVDEACRAFEQDFRYAEQMAKAASALKPRN